MAVKEPFSERGLCRLLGLPFEGFLEALCRIAALKALPTDGQLHSHGGVEAWRFLDELANERPDEYAAFLGEWRTPWGEPPHQPLCRSLDHLLRLLVHTIESRVPPTAAGVKIEGQVNETEARIFFSTQPGWDAKGVYKGA